MTRLNAILGATGILLGIAALVHGLLSSSGTVVFAITVNLSFLIIGVFLFIALASLKKTASEQTRAMKANFLLINLFFVLVVIIVNVMVRENLHRDAILAKPLERIRELKGRSYEWKRYEFGKENFPEGRHFGVIAQEIEKVLPDLVATRPDGMKAVAYFEIIPILIEAVKEQQKIIETQKKEIDEIKEMVKKIKK